MTLDDIFNIDPATTKVLKKFHLTHLLGQHVEFEEACNRNGICYETVKKELLSVYCLSNPHFGVLNWTPDRLADSLHKKQHASIKKLTKKINSTLDQVICQYGSSRLELNRIKSSFNEIKEGLEKHMYTEEMIIFPAIQNIVNISKGQINEREKLFRLLYPIEVMKAEHEKIFRYVADIKKVSRNFKVPKNASTAFNYLYEQLRALESVLRNILAIENNILYPAALKLEKEAVCFE